MLKVTHYRVTFSQRKNRACGNQRHDAYQHKYSVSHLCSPWCFSIRVYHFSIRCLSRHSYTLLSTRAM
jgi:hypothetical protein